MTYHKLDVEQVGISSSQLLLGVTDALPCVGVEVPHKVSGLTWVLAGVDWLVHDLQRANVKVVGVCVDAISHPFQELVGALEVVIVVEARVRHALVALVSDKVMEDVKVEGHREQYLRVR